jgi:hypothetical protein
MVTRREFTITLVLTPIAAWFGSNCGGSDGYGGGDGTTSNTSPTLPCDGLGARSSLTEGHVHDLCVPAADLSSPPAGGKTYDTSSEDGHMHRVTLDAAQLAAVNRGEVVRVTTSTEDGHAHAYSLARAGTISAEPQPGGTSSGGNTSSGSSSGSSSGY